ncbi:hypothetical protein [Tautonia marina]|uniref:hypothetical protein n=1 Tax=Tautonia marina TaxID=2653855 RepID=UPI0012609B18|nr:hypothetical protein [Tautonia marina]
MDPQQIVRSRFPHAQAIHREPVYVLGQREPYMPGGWVVLSSPTLGAEHLGSGPTEDAAWAAAADTISEQTSSPRLSFKEWLEEQAKREGGVELRRRLIEDWKDAVADLLAQMIKWLAEEDTQKVLTVETGKISKEEQGLGIYDVAALRINLAAKFVEVIPEGRNIVGAIGRSGDLGLRAEGRVDMRNRTRKYMLFRVASADAKKWNIVDDDNYTIQDFSKETFVAALQDLLS